MFSADPANPSFVDIAITTGLLFLKWDFAAIVAGVSIIPFANFAIVFPEHGAISITSVNCFGPIGSAPCIVCIIFLPVISSTFFITSSASPNLVSNS